jgi:hypothetical protein
VRKALKNEEKEKKYCWHTSGMKKTNLGAMSFFCKKNVIKVVMNFHLVEKLVHGLGNFSFDLILGFFN